MKILFLVTRVEYNSRGVKQASYSYEDESPKINKVDKGAEVKNNHPAH